SATCIPLKVTIGIPAPGLTVPPTKYKLLTYLLCLGNLKPLFFLRSDTTPYIAPLCEPYVEAILLGVHISSYTICFLKSVKSILSNLSRINSYNALYCASVQGLYCI